MRDIIVHTVKNFQGEQWWPYPPGGALDKLTEPSK